MPKPVWGKETVCRRDTRNDIEEQSYQDTNNSEYYHSDNDTYSKGNNFLRREIVDALDRVWTLSVLFLSYTRRQR